MGNIQQKFTGDASQLEAEYQKILASQIKLEEQLGRIKAKAESAGQKQGDLAAAVKRGATQAVNSLRDMALGYASVQSMIQLVNAELRIKKELEATSAKTSVSLADAQAQVAINIGDVSDQNFQAFLAKVTEIKTSTGFASEVPLLQAASSTLSAVAGDQKVTADILQTLAPIFKSAPEDLAGVSEVVGDLMLTSKKDAKETVGLVLSTMGQARVTSLQAFKNVAPAVAGSVATQKGVPLEKAATEAAAAFAAIGSVIKDPEGALTRTATANLSANLEKAFPGAFSLGQRLDMAQNMGDQIQAAIAKGQAPDAKMVAIQNELVQSGFEGAVKPVIRDLLSGNQSQAAQAFDSALSKIGFDGAATDRMAARLEGGTLNLALANRGRAFSGALEQAAADPAQEILGTSRAIFENALDGVYQGFGTAYSRWAAKTATFTQEDMIAQLQLAEGNIRENYLFGNLRGPRSDAQLTQTEQAQIGVIKAAMEQINKNLQDNQKRNEARSGAALQANQHNERD